MRRRPDELGRYVVWDLMVGSYDRHLERLRAERAVHDPPPLSVDRLHELVVGVLGDDDADRRLAAHDLALVAEAEYHAQCADEDDREDPDDPGYQALRDQAQQEEYLTPTGAA